MKTTSLKTIYLTADELKQSIVEYLAKEHEDLAQHLYDNECDMVWGQDSKEFLVSIDGEVEDEENKEDKSLPWYGKCAHCFGGYADQECTCEPHVSKMETIHKSCIASAGWASSHYSNFLEHVQVTT